MISKLIDFFAGLRVKLLLAAGISVAVLALIARVFYAGKKAARDEIAAKNAQAIKEAKDVASEIHALDRADVDDRLARWMRDGRR